MWDFWTFPDQSKYLNFAKISRDKMMCFFNCYEHHEDWLIQNYTNLHFPSFLISLIPLPFIETLNSLGFFSKLVFNLSIIIFYNQNKKIFDEKLIYFLLIFPSIILYTSLNLKDIYLISFVILYASFMFNKNILLSILVLYLIFIFRHYYIPFILSISALFLFFKNIDKFKKLKIYQSKQIILILPIVIILYFFFGLHDFVFNLIGKLFIKLQFIRSELAIENETFINPADTKNLLSIFISSFTKGFIAPFSLDASKLNTIFVLENILMNFLFFYVFLKIPKTHFTIKLFIFFSFLFVIVFLGFTVSNLVTLYRYKIPLLILILLLVVLSLVSKKNIIHEKK